MSVIEDIPLQTGRADLTHRVFHAADGRLPALREMEARLLGYLAAHPERVLPYEELLRNVWGYRAGHDRAVIHTTVRRLRRIISDPASSPNHLFSVRGEGYRFVPLAALPPPVQLVPAPVPLQATALIGRDRALQQLHALTETAPLVTVTGPGGVGKTSLVQHLLTETHTRYPGGTRFVDLSEAETRAQLFSAVAAALDMALPKWDIASALGAALDERGAHLLVLDNFEQLVDEAADVVARWVDRATAGRFVITSRVSLRLPTEQLISLRPLSTEDAAMLFVERARMRAPTLSIEPHHEDLSALVEMLDRLPLAIELAAARSRMMSPATMRRRLSTQPDLLRSRQTDRPDRHRSLRATVAWSLNLLDPVQRDLLEQCGVFVGGFTLDALEAVASLPDDDRYVDEILEDLIEHSLVVVRSEADPVRFGMLFTIREFVVEQLNARPDRDDILRRHAGFYARFGTRDFIQSARIGPDSDRNRQRMIDDLDNYRAGARRGSPEDAAYCAFAAYARLSKQGPYAEAEQLIRDVLTMDGLHPYTRAWALGNLQSMLNNQLQSQESLRVGAQAVALAEKAGAPSLAASLTQEIGYTHKQ
ncbi:MAG: winged helix-turn-helix domain-containing protein, partial [Myxococcota bacterium]